VKPVREGISSRLGGGRRQGEGGSLRIEGCGWGGGGDVGGGLSDDGCGGAAEGEEEGAIYGFCF
jgi:hypothetical protein